MESTLAGCAKVLFSETRLAAAYCIIIAPLCNPGSGQDHVSMGTTAARHGYQIIENARRVLAIECVIALQAAAVQPLQYLYEIDGHV
jgi:histidine ammonia-lyase